ncbi:MAG: MFS transporter [Conexivisphaerales archaeon]
MAEQKEQIHTFVSILPVLSVMLLTRLSFGVIAIIFPVYIVASGTGTGIALALYPIAEAFAAPVIGSYSDKGGRKIAFTLGLISLSLLNLILSTTRNLDIASALHALMGVSAAAVTVSTLALITDYTVKSNRGRWMGGFDFSNLAGYAIGFLLGAYFAHIYSTSLQDSFLVVGMILLVTGVISFFAVKDVKIERTQKLYLNPFSGVDKSTLALLPVWFSLTVVIGVAFFLPKALNSSGVNQLSSGLLLFGVVAVIGIGSIIWGWVSDHIGRNKTLWIGIVGLILFLIAAMDVVQNPQNLLSLSRISILVPLILMLSAVVPSLLAAVGDRALVMRRGSVMGLYSFLLSIGLATGNLLAGVAYDWMQLHGVLLVALVEVLVNIAVALILRLTIAKESREVST